MDFVRSAFTLVVIGCCAPAIHAQSSTAAAAAPAQPTGDGTLARIGHWFTMDWSTGWQAGSTKRLMTSPYTYHFSRDPNHRQVYMLGLERERSDGLLLGGTVFRNSFGQPSGYVYVGQRFDGLGDVEPLFAELTGGVLYGYRPPYNHKVPLDYGGFSPGLVPSLGWRFTPVLSAQVNFLGNAAVMFQFSADFE